VQVPQVKNGEQPAHGFEELPLACACSVLVAVVQTSSAQQGLTDNSNTYKQLNQSKSLIMQS